LESVLGETPRGFESRILRRVVGFLEFSPLTLGALEDEVVMSGNHSTSGRSRLLTVLLVTAGIVIAFVGGLGAAKLLHATGNTGAPGPNQSALPCVTVTTLLGAGLPKPSEVQINVYNAAHIAGLARRTGADLATDGFVVLTKTNDPLGKTLTDVGEIRFGTPGAKSAALLLAYVHGARLVNDGRTDGTVDFAVGKAYVALSTPAQVLAALSKPVPVASGAGCPAG
jgi:hypothetical protein